MQHFSRIVLLIIFVGVSHLPSEGLSSIFGKMPRKTPDPINIDTSKVKNVLLPFVFLHGVLNDKVRLVNSGKSVVLKLDQPTTRTTVTGGPFGFAVYEFYEKKYIWTDNKKGSAGTTIDGKGYWLEIIATFRNRKYKTFEEALEKRDGLAILDFPIRICQKPNPLFSNYAEKLKQIQKAGANVTTTLGTAIGWYAKIIIPLIVSRSHPLYYAYLGSYIDPNTEKIYSCATVLILQDLPQACLSEEQFEETFGSIEDSSGQPLTTKEKQHPRKVQVVGAILKGVYQTVSP